MRNIARYSLVAALALAPSSVALADLIVFKDGRKVEGEVVEKTATKVVVKTKFGTSEFPAAEVERIEPKNTPEQEFAARRAKVDPKSADQLYDLFLFAKENRMAAKSKELLKEILKADPDHESAHKELGHVKFNDKWVSEAEAKKLAKADEDNAMKAKGLVKYKDKWITPEEKETAEHEEKGEILIDGKWVNKKDAEKAQASAKLAEEVREHKAKGEYLVAGKWVGKDEAEKHYSNIATPYRAEGEHAMVMTNKGIDIGERVLVEVERAYRQCAEVLGTEPARGATLMPIYLCATLEDMNQLGQALNGDEKSSAYHAWCSPWLAAHPDNFEIVSVTMYYREKGTNKDTLTDIFARHAIAEQYIERVIGKDATDTPSPWFVDGFASYMERWDNARYFNWSRDILRGLGALSSLKVFFGSFSVSEQNILQAGLVVAFLRSDKCPPEVKTAFDEAIQAIKTKGKVGKAFKKLEKAMIEKEDVFLDFAETKQQG